MVYNKQVKACIVNLSWLVTSYIKFDWLIELRWAILGLTEQLLHEKIDR